MSALSYGCQSCSTIDSFNGSLQGIQQQSFGMNNNNAVNQLIQENNFNEPPMNNPANSGMNPDVSYNADLRQNNYGGNNYNQPQMNHQPQMNNQTYGNGNQVNQHPMNSNYNDVKVPQVIATSAKPAPPRAKPVESHVVRPSVVDRDEKPKLGCYLKLGLVILIALALHETIKYYINHSIKFNEGSPTYFVYYTLACMAALFLVQNYVKLE